jgi:hypothetical protein
MKKLQTLLTLLMFTCASQSMHAMFKLNQLSIPFVSKKLTLDDLSKHNRTILERASEGFHLPNLETFSRAILEEQLQLHPREAVEWHISPAYTTYLNAENGRTLADQIINDRINNQDYVPELKTLQLENLNLNDVMANNQKILSIAWFLHASTPQYNPGNMLIVADENQKLFDYLHTYVTALNANKNTKTYGFKQVSPEKIDKDLQSKEIYTINLGENFTGGRTPGNHPDVSFGKLNNSQTFMICGNHNYGWFERI